MFYLMPLALGPFLLLILYLPNLLLYYVVHLNKSSAWPDMVAKKIAFIETIWHGDQKFDIYEYNPTFCMCKCEP